MKRTQSGTYNPPKARAHRGFAYLDTDILINSLSALEAGKVDEVVEKINLAQERGLSVGLKFGVSGVGASADASQKGSESLQAEVIRRRTRFSIFEIWHKALREKQAIGTFSGWGSGSLTGVTAGDVVELRGTVELVSLQTAFRLFLWFVNQVRNKNPLFATGANLNELQAQEKTIKFMLGERDEMTALFTPQGEPGPRVAVTFFQDWLIEPVGRWNGTYTLIAQVEEVLAEGDTWQTMRIIDDAPLTQLERETVEKAVAPFGESIGAFGLTLDPETTKVDGPALVLRPIALYR